MSIIVVSNVIDASSELFHTCTSVSSSLYRILLLTIWYVSITGYARNCQGADIFSICFSQGVKDWTRLTSCESKRWCSSSSWLCDNDSYFCLLCISMFVLFCESLFIDIWSLLYSFCCFYFYSWSSNLFNGVLLIVKAVTCIPFELHVIVWHVMVCNSCQFLTRIYKFQFASINFQLSYFWAFSYNTFHSCLL